MFSNYGPEVDCAAPGVEIYVIKSTAEDVNSYIYPGEDDFLGSGRINAYNALMFFEQPASPEPEPDISVWTTIGYEYDSNGNQIKRTVYRQNDSVQGMTAYAYDYENRLVGITHPDGTTSQHVYDGTGRRVQSDVKLLRNLAPLLT